MEPNNAPTGLATARTTIGTRPIVAAIAQPATLAVAIEMRPPIAQQAIVPRSGKAAIVAASEPHTMVDPVAVVQRRAAGSVVVTRRWPEAGLVEVARRWPAAGTAVVAASAVVAVDGGPTSVSNTM
jgi:hypothetical protein